MVIRGALGRFGFLLPIIRNGAWGGEIQTLSFSRCFAVHLILRCDPDLSGGASKDAGPSASAYILRGPLHGHLRMRIEDKLARSRGAWAPEF